jgi:hypothetical protein
MIGYTLWSNGKNLGFRATVERQTCAIAYSEKCFSLRTGNRWQELSVGGGGGGEEKNYVDGKKKKEKKRS